MTCKKVFPTEPALRGGICLAAFEPDFTASRIRFHPHLTGYGTSADPAVALWHVLDLERNRGIENLERVRGDASCVPKRLSSSFPLQFQPFSTAIRPSLHDLWTRVTDSDGGNMRRQPVVDSRSDGRFSGGLFGAAAPIHSRPASLDSQN